MPALGSFLLIIVLAVFILLLVCYILTGIGLYKINKSKGNKGSWMAWIPFLNYYLLLKLGFNKIIGIITVLLLLFSGSTQLSVNGEVVANISFLPPFVSYIIMGISLVLMIISAAKLYKQAGKKSIILIVVSVVTFGLALPFFIFSMRNLSFEGAVKEEPPVNNNNPIENPLPEEPIEEPVQPIESIWQDKTVEEDLPLPLPSEMTEQEQPLPVDLNMVQNVTPIQEVTEQVPEINNNFSFPEIPATPKEVEPSVNTVPVQDTSANQQYMLDQNNINQDETKEVNSPQQFIMNQDEPNQSVDEEIPNNKQFIMNQDSVKEEVAKPLNQNQFLENNNNSELTQQPQKVMSVEELLNSQSFK